MIKHKTVHTLNPLFPGTTSSPVLMNPESRKSEVNTRNSQVDLLMIDDT